MGNQGQDRERKERSLFLFRAEYRIDQSVGRSVSVNPPIPNQSSTTTSTEAEVRPVVVAWRSGGVEVSCRSQSHRRNVMFGDLVMELWSMSLRPGRRADMRDGAPEHEGNGNW